MIKTFLDLLILKKSMVFVTTIYSTTQQLPVTESYGLIGQMRRSAVSIPSNIAEGYGRNTTDEYKRFLTNAVSSLYELQTQLEICFNLNYISRDQLNGMIHVSREIERMMTSLISKI